jgi:hypothetical protein
MPLQRGRGGGDGQDVALDELLALGAVLEALLEVVCGALALELEGLCLQGAVRVSALFSLPSACVWSGRWGAYGAVFVSSRMWRFFRSCTSGRCWRCFSKLPRRSWLRVGEMGVSSMDASAMVSA